MGSGALGALIYSYMTALSDANKKNTQQAMIALGDAIEDFITPSIAPIGAILAWHKSLSGVPSLPDGWLECDGSTVSDAESPLDGVTLPDLNGDRRFLRGDSVSGTEEVDTMQGHRHDAAYDTSSLAAGSYSDRWGIATAGQYNSSYMGVGPPRNDGSNGTPRTASETKPINMSVVWIIRIK